MTLEPFPGSVPLPGLAGDDELAELPTAKPRAVPPAKLSPDERARPCHRCGCPIGSHSTGLDCRVCGARCGLSCGRIRVPGIGLVSIVALEGDHP